jgi:hypothetical protein
VKRALIVLALAAFIFPASASALTLTHPSPGVVTFVRAPRPSGVASSSDAAGPGNLGADWVSEPDDPDAPEGAWHWVSAEQGPTIYVSVLPTLPSDVLSSWGLDDANLEYGGERIWSGEYRQAFDIMPTMMSLDFVLPWPNRYYLVQLDGAHNYAVVCDKPDDANPLPVRVTNEVTTKVVGTPTVTVSNMTTGASGAVFTSGTAPAQIATVAISAFGPLDSGGIGAFAVLGLLYVAGGVALWTRSRRKR